jgi:L-threonylcarbamoyladenylate synthase
MISKDINLAVQILKKEGVIGMPTETVYGLAAKMTSELGIKKIFKLKNRPLNNPLIVHIGKIEDLALVAKNVSPKIYELAKLFWPGPLTLILEKNKNISNLITSNQPTVAVRMPNHAMALEIINKLGCPIVAPSANPYMAVSPTSAKHVRNYFNHQLPLVIDGGYCKNGIESTIIGFENEDLVLYRQGTISKEVIERKSNRKIIDYNHDDSKIITSGMQKKHYAPKTNLILTNSIVKCLEKVNSENVGVISYISNSHKLFKSHFVLSHTSTLEDAAANLYRLLIEVDKMGFDYIIIEEMPKKGIGISINDRLKRASFKEIYY